LTKIITTVFNLTDESHLSAKVVVLAIQQSNESGVNGAFVRQRQRAVDDDAEDFAFVGGQIRL